MSDVLPALMTTDEVAEALRLSPSTIARWAKNGKLPAVKLGDRGSKSSVRFRRVDVLAFLDGARTS
jgi:excisionase family DNA binding protein